MAQDLLAKGESFKCPHCGTIHPRVTSVCPESGKSISMVHKFAGRLLESKYQIERIIGEGGMGVVYFGVQKNINKTVAIKFFNQHACTDRDSIDRFINEAKFSASIGHENIINVFNFGYIDEAVPYIVMEFLKGESLGRLLMKERVLTIERAVDITSQILNALHAVHASNIIHRDLKPENVFLARQTGGNEIVKLLDFGISCIMKSEDMGRRLSEAGRVYGTPYYVSPEQAEGSLDVDHRADVYSTGVLLYEMLTGQLPFRAKTYAALLVEILTKPPPNPKDLSDEIPADLVEIILRALEKKPESRYQSAREMMEDVRRIKEKLRGNIFPEVLRGSEPPKKKKKDGIGTGSRKRRISITGYSMFTPEEKISTDSPYFKARLRRSSAPPEAKKVKPGLSTEDKERLETASSEIIDILKVYDKAGPSPVILSESGAGEKKKPSRTSKPTPLVIPGTDISDGEEKDEKAEESSDTEVKEDTERKT